MDMDRLSYRSLYSATLFQVMTPISIATQFMPCLQDRGLQGLCAAQEHWDFP